MTSSLASFWGRTKGDMGKTEDGEHGTLDQGLRRTKGAGFRA